MKEKKNTKYNEEEISNLAQNINLIVKYQKNIIIRKITPALFFGKGQVQNFKIYLKEYSSNLLLINSQINQIYYFAKEMVQLNFFKTKKLINIRSV